MCGIAGIWCNTPVDNSKLKNVSSSFTQALRHRGPDNYGSYIDDNLGLLLCHTRLSILDLSSEGNQPKQSISNRYTISFNGEIYNHLFLRSICPQTTVFRGTSDTETILALLDCFGFSQTIQLLEGMFAISIWDSISQTLYLARDRFGEKPLYWGNISLFDTKTLCFSSDLEPIFSIIPFLRSDLDYTTLHTYFKYGFIPNEMSIHKSFSQVPPGSFLTFKRESFIGEPLVTTYWSPEDQLSNERMRFDGSFNNAVNHLDFLITESVSSKLISDVPLACFLSGGIDSSLLACIYSNISGKQITTLNVSFPDLQDKYFDESTYASIVADSLGANHIQLNCSSTSVINNVTRILSSYSEPFSDLSQLPTYLISEHASNLGFKVVLSGDGGDELFGGYNRHVFANYYQKFGLKHFSKLSQLFSSLLSYYPSSTLDLSQNTLAKLISTLSVDPKPSLLYNSLLDRNILSLPTNSHPSLFTDSYQFESNFCVDFFNSSSSILDLAHSFMLLDTQFYLPSDILTKVDRASMANSIEIRSPFLDTNLFNFAWSLPSEFLFKSMNVSFSGKQILRTLLSRYLPKSITKRPKHGFSVPMANWLRGPLRSWANDLLEPNEIDSFGILNSSYIQKLWLAHLSGKSDHSNILWSVIVWQFWIKRFIS